VQTLKTFQIQYLNWGKGLNQKRKDGYVTGIVCLIVFGLCAPIAISVGWNISGQIFGIFAGIFAFLGFGSIAKPESIGNVVAQILENLSRNVDDAESSSQSNTQKHTNGSVQVNATKGAYVNFQNSSSQGKPKPKTNNGGKTFCCPNGHPIAVFQPDDSHNTAAREKQHADKNASGTIIPITYTCVECNSQITLYWYRTKIYFG
jgi:hypothetical protein